MTAEERRDRDIAQALAHITRGPCGGWHFTENRSRNHFCRACTALGSLPTPGRNTA